MKPEPLPCGWTPGPREPDSPELAEAKRQMARLLAVGKLAMRMRAEHPDWREGQAAFNALRELDPDCAMAVLAASATGPDIDPFHVDGRLDAFWEFVTEWKAQ